MYSCVLEGRGGQEGRRGKAVEGCGEGREKRWKMVRRTGKLLYRTTKKIKKEKQMSADRRFVKLVKLVYSVHNVTSEGIGTGRSS